MTPTKDEFWTLIDTSNYERTQTYQHVLGHGTLIRVRATYSDTVAESIVFIPEDPRNTVPYR